jgi:hypothetical protein
VNFKSLSNVLTSKVGRQILHLQKHSPTILFAAGVVGVVGTVVLASRATLKLEEIVIDHEVMAGKAEIVRDSQEYPEYTEAAYKKDLVLLYMKTSAKVLKLYAPAIVIGAASIAALSGAHLVLNRRNVGLTAAYAALEKGYQEYRKRVVDQYGDDKDRELRYGLQDKEIVEEDEHGAVVTTVKALSSGEQSIYARFFDELSPSWERNMDYNRLFVQCQQNYANDLFRARGHVFLNEVYAMLGIPHSKEGAVVGWVKGHGDDFIDFGVFRNNEYRGMEFVNGEAPGILLDFNVAGVIYDKI